MRIIAVALFIQGTAEVYQTITAAVAALDDPNANHIGPFVKVIPAMMTIWVSYQLKAGMLAFKEAIKAGDSCPPDEGEVKPLDAGQGGGDQVLNGLEHLVKATKKKQYPTLMKAIAMWVGILAVWKANWSAASQQEL